MAVPARGGNTRSIAQAMGPATAAQDWLFETIANRFAAALETETGEQPDMRWESALRLRQRNSPARENKIRSDDSRLNSHREPSGSRRPPKRGIHWAGTN